MENVTFIDIDGKEHAIIDRGNGEFTSMPKATYDAQLAAQSTLPSESATPQAHLTESVTE
jgi:hypothetical protein